MSGPTRPATLVCPPGRAWYYCLHEPCEVCGGTLQWWDCADRIHGCVRCDDCGAEYYVEVISASEP